MISHGGKMGIIDYVKGWFLNIDWISTTQIREMMEYIIDDVDSNHNGWISTKELIEGVKKWMKKK